MTEYAVRTGMVVVEADHARLAPSEAVEALMQSMQDDGMYQHVRFEVTNLITGQRFIVVNDTVEKVLNG